jgi:DNA-binding GntR family transcriptional regulator
MSRRPTAQDAVLAALREDILTGVLEPGDQLVQEALAERYGVSRVPLREALKMLESEGQVVNHPHRGYFVAELSVADLREVYHLRGLLERAALTAAVPLLDEVDIEEIAGLGEDVDTAAREGDVLAMAEANRRFHFALFDAAAMPRLSRLLRQLWEATDAYRALYYQQQVNRSRVLEEHDSMIAALRDRDVDRVIALHDEHRAQSVAAVESMLTSHGRSTTARRPLESSAPTLEIT